MKVGIKEEIKKLLIKVVDDDLFDKYFTPNRVNVYHKLFTILAFNAVPNLSLKLKSFYFMKAEWGKKEYINTFSTLMQDILLDLKYCESRASVDLKELIYIHQHFLPNMYINNAIAHPLTAEANKLLNSIVKMVLESGNM